MIKGLLFPTEFLQERITQTKEWKALPDGYEQGFHTKMRGFFDTFATYEDTNEDQVKKEIIESVLDELGWHYMPEKAINCHDRPDYVLFESQKVKNKAGKASDPSELYPLGLTVLEAKAWEVQLDRKTTKFNSNVPSSQIIRYLRNVQHHSNGNIQFGILTNGQLWRIYYTGAKSMAEEFLEIDLNALIKQEAPNKEEWHLLRLFCILFSPTVYKQQAKTKKPALELYKEDSLHWEQQVAESLKEKVYEVVFPRLMEEMVASDAQANINDPDYLENLRENALTYLYRLLFIFYAEDRELLPVYHDSYQNYCIQNIRQEIAQKIDGKVKFTSRGNQFESYLKSLFTIVDKGDEGLGIPPYNGGLFDGKNADLIDRIQLADVQIAPLLDLLSRRETEQGRKWINYRDLTVQQLGSIYEGLLDFHPEFTAEGKLTLTPNVFARKTTGSYYTPESLVKIVVSRALQPYVDEYEAEFQERLQVLSKESTSQNNSLEMKQKKLEKKDPALRLLELKICDPAMGSGHFLVSLVDYMADLVLEILDQKDESQPLSKKLSYVSPVTKSIRKIRQRILQEAEEKGWHVKEEHLDDKHLVRRMILKRCVYGVDKNHMAVELAKVALWLHTFTVGAPLSFLDHHLKTGDSLFGEWVGKVFAELNAGGNILGNNYIMEAKAGAESMVEIERLTDADITEVKQSAEYYEQVLEATQPLNKFLQFYHAHRWLIGKKDKEKRQTFQRFKDGHFGNPVDVANGKKDPAFPWNNGFPDYYQEAWQLIEEEHFFNWELNFPGIWDNWSSENPTGGFDIVLGNPPWDRMKLQQVEWFADRDLNIANQAKAADRKKLIKQHEKANDELWQAFDHAAKKAKKATEIARDHKGYSQYPLLGRGDVNLYSLFVERAHRLIKPNGYVCLVVPSGISGDKTASEFFQSISTAGRLKHLYDFENKKVFFPDIHSSFKFSIYHAGGEKQHFDHTELAFFVHDTEELEDPERVFTMTAQDFRRVNPNTGTVPIFRNRRDARIVNAIYEKFPVLSHEEKGMAYPVKYYTMFHMTNDSHLFHTKDELEKAGFYPTKGGVWKKGKEEMVPLYVGKMIYHYNHRHNSVVVNKKNLKVAAHSENTTLEQLSDSKYLPTPQYWVLKDKVVELLNKCSKENLDNYFNLCFRDITNTTNERAMVAAFAPIAGLGNTLPTLITPLKSKIELLAIFNSFAFDFVARTKMQGTHLNYYTVQQLPVIPPETFEQEWEGTKLADFVKEQVLRLSYTAWDMEPFARAMGYEGDPFTWDPEDRLHRQCKLDALFMLLYEIAEDDAAYILETFPIVKKKDMEKYGRYRTQELILGYMRALRVCDFEVSLDL